MKSFRDYLGLSNSCSYDIDDVIGRADRFGFQNFCSPAPGQGQKTPWEQTFDVNRKPLSLRPFVASFKQISLNSDFIHIF